MQFPEGEPRASIRPDRGKWYGYTRTDAEPAISSAVTRSVFDRQVVILAIEGCRVTLPATLKLTAALRGMLMRECPAQPPSEWFSGHESGGRPTTAPHLALAPLPFVGAENADGRVMGMALIPPRASLARCPGRSGSLAAFC